MTIGRRGRKLDKKVSEEVMKKVRVDIPDLGQGCPDGAEGFFATHIVHFNKLQQMMAKMQPDIQKLIKIQVKDILESLDPKNIGKSREIKIPNPQFNPKEKRTDSDTSPCKGDNPFWMTSYESVYDRDRFRPNVVENAKNMLLSNNKEIVQEYKMALQEIYKAADEFAKEKEGLEEGKGADVGEKGKSETSSSLMGDEWIN
jgi:hypothetical protein|tara:strand:- start:1234 stop:1836 length:603 start_codon:yes stop_codon:yes gene_type:complete